jgi:hypothetical protein
MEKGVMRPTDGFALPVLGKRENAKELIGGFVLTTVSGASLKGGGVERHLRK